MPDYVKADFDFLSGLIESYSIQTIIEIGSFHGSSACFFAKHDRVTSVVCVDPFEVSRHDPWWEDLKVRNIANPYWDTFLANILKSPYKEKIHPVRGYSYNSYDYVARAYGRADMVYVDGNHSYEDCRLDILNYLPLARKIMVGDDYQNDPKTGFPYFPGVSRAVREIFPSHEVTGRFWWRRLP